MKYLGHNFCDLRSWKDVSHGSVEPGIRIQNLPSIVSDRDALADEIGSEKRRLFRLLYGGTKTDTLTSLRYARDMAMVAKSNKVVSQ